MMLTNLADVVRRSGLEVIEVPGWKTRGHGEMTAVDAIINHHTAGPETGDFPSLATVRDGRPDLDGPLAQLGLGRSGRVWVIAAGVCYHAGATFQSWQNNWHAIGIEAEATGTDEWPDDQYEAYVRLNRALCDGYGVPVDRVLGHKEIAKPLGRKTDPNFDMGAMRRAVASLNHPPTDTTSEDEMTPAQMTELKDYTDERMQAYSLWLDMRARRAELLVAKAKKDTAAVAVLQTEYDAAYKSWKGITS